MARLMRVGNSQELLQDILTQGWRIGGPGRYVECTEGVPEGAKIVGSSHDRERLVAYLFFEHESFEDVLEGGHVPEMKVTHSISG